MKIVVVKFDKSNREYEFKTNLNLITGGIYDIIADDDTHYTSPVEILGYRKQPVFKKELRVITDATCITGPRRPESGIKNVYFNEEKRTTAVVWVDGTKTVVKCDPHDVWSKEAGLALCYMKRALHNRGAFNEILKKYCCDD